MKTRNTLPHRQQGIALVIFAIGLVVIIGIAGMALDLGRVMLDDARVQNAMDACALSSTKVLMETTGDATDKIDAALIAAEDTFDVFKNDPDNHLSGLNWGDIAVTFSETLEGTFSGSADPPRYARCAVDTYSITTTLSRVLGITDLGLNVTAVAGPIFIDDCNPMPLMVCGDPNDDCEFEDDDGTCYGFSVYKEDDPDYVEEECYIKACPGVGNEKCYEALSGLGVACGTHEGQPFEIGAGNFHFLDMPCDVNAQGGMTCIKEAFETGGGTFTNGCLADGDPLDLAPGNKQVIANSYYNLIFDQDSNATEPSVYSDYSEGIPTEGNNSRVLGIVIADCTVCGENGCKGASENPTVLTTGCFFATRRIDDAANGANSVAYGQFINRCTGTGSITKTPDVFDNYKIVLYKDYQGPDS